MPLEYDPIAESKAMNIALYGDLFVYNPTKKWYWKCLVCDCHTFCEQFEAMTIADNHDKEIHKKKPTSSFGWEL